MSLWGGCEWVIYTHLARLVRSLSDHDDACDETYRMSDLTRNGETLDAILMQAAFCSMLADVEEEIGFIKAMIAEKDLAL